MRRAKTVAVLVTVVSAAALAVGVPTAAADERVCRGTLGAITVDDLRVPQRATCTLKGTRVEGNIKVSLPVTLTQEGDDQTLTVRVRYQACSHMGCFAPKTITLELPVRAADHVERPRRR